MKTQKGLFSFFAALALISANSAFAQSPPANDDFANRTVLTGSSITFTGTLVGATSEPAETNIPGSLRSGPGPLRPTWGEPELHMSLAWSYLHRRMPDVAEAEVHGRKALQLVPSWHYMRDILMPQIEAARRTASRQD